MKTETIIYLFLLFTEIVGQGRRDSTGGECQENLFVFGLHHWWHAAKLHNRH